MPQNRQEYGSAHETSYASRYISRVGFAMALPWSISTLEIRKHVTDNNSLGCADGSCGCPNQGGAYQLAAAGGG